MQPGLNVKHDTFIQTLYSATASGITEHSIFAIRANPLCFPSIERIVLGLCICIVSVQYFRGVRWCPIWVIKWTASSVFSTYRLCEQRRFRRACASAQSRQNLRCSLIQAVNQEEPSSRKPDPWPLWMAGHAQLKFVMTECSKTQIRLTGPKLYRFRCVASVVLNRSSPRWYRNTSVYFCMPLFLVGRKRLYICIWKED